MGTSKSFSDVKKSMVPNWGKLSSSLTTNCDSSHLPSDKLKIIMRNFVSTLGSASAGGRGISNVGGKSSIRTAKKLGKLFANFIGSGYDIRDTLKFIGLTDIDNKSVGDIINHLIEYCSENATSIDDIAAKEATRLLLEEIIGQEKTIDEVENKLKDTFKDQESLNEIIVKYFAYYINELLSKWFYENLIKKKNEIDCNTLFSQIRNYIESNLLDLHKRYRLQNLDWSSEKADIIIKDIQQEILTIFE
ncbi:hypothetical protein G9H62_00040 [Aquirufa ecclesiirivi]|uniref:hypothetical protein n=1 Tax=Aquirufa ecclesiirivi TaxID=2715124 RepID=UPI0022A8150C|nr:hypothetical protein [Aquirufa ecclesiirivi]MCZ2471213.1 hypothetical protein [Aquirufa ecclesiirivi]